VFSQILDQCIPWRLITVVMRLTRTGIKSTAWPGGKPTTRTRGHTTTWQLRGRGILEASHQIEETQ